MALPPHVPVVSPLMPQQCLSIDSHPCIQLHMYPTENSTTFNSHSGWGFQINCSKCCLCVCLDVNQVGTHRNRCTQRLVIIVIIDRSINQWVGSSVSQAINEKDQLINVIIIITFYSSVTSLREWHCNSHSVFYVVGVITGWFSRTSQETSFQTFFSTQWCIAFNQC